MPKTGWTLIVLLLLAMALPSASAFALTEIMNVRNWTAPDHTRIVFDISDEPRYRVEKSDKKLSISFDEVTVNTKVRSELAINKTGLRSVAIRSLPDNVAMVEFLLTDGAETKVFSLQKVQDKPHRLVVDIWLPDVEKKQSEEREQVKTRIKDRIVVIDPGHGGDDPGAIGKGGTREKDVVLSLGMKLRNALNGKKGYHAFLTREGDYYVSFKKRLRMAREYGADIFISIHADAAQNRTARGSSVYCLSLGGASSEAARIMARKENLADIVGGAENGTESDESDPIVLNMFQTNTINQSKTFGYRLLNNLQEVSRPKSARVQEAPFMVLKLPEIPALLLETAYISNPREEKLLRSGAFQTRVAAAVADSITEYFQSAPPASPATAVSPSVPPPVAASSAAPSAGQTAFQPARVAAAAQPVAHAPDSPPARPIPQRAPPRVEKRKMTLKAEEEEKPESRPAVYRVRRGDTLAKIAARNNMTLGALLKLNRMKMEGPLYVGREIKLENAEKAAAGIKGNSAGGARAASGLPSGKTSASASRPSSSATNFYRVKQGDTLAKVASKHKTTIGVLLKLNRMRLNDPLYVDRKLILPQHASL